MQNQQFISEEERAAYAKIQAPMLRLIARIGDFQHSFDGWDPVWTVLFQDRRKRWNSLHVSYYNGNYFISCHVLDMWRAALRYCQSAAKESSLKAEAMACLADGLYCRSSELRIRTAQALFDLGDVRWVDAVKGTAADFERLGKIDVPTHEETIRALIAVADSCGTSNYAKKLRNVIFLRARAHPRFSPMRFEIGNNQNNW